MDGVMSNTARKNLEEVVDLVVNHGQDLYSTVGRLVFGSEELSVDQWCSAHQDLRNIIKFLMLLKSDSFIKEYIERYPIGYTLEEIYVKIFYRFMFSEVDDLGVSTMNESARTFVVYMFGYVNMLKELKKNELCGG